MKSMDSLNIHLPPIYVQSGFGTFCQVSRSGFSHRYMPVVCSGIRNRGNSKPYKNACFKIYLKILHAG